MGIGISRNMAARPLDKFINIEINGDYEIFIIRCVVQEVQQRIQRVVDLWGPNGSQPSEEDYKEEMAKIRKAIVDFHGEMVLLVNYSNINYTGVFFFFPHLKVPK